MNKQKNAKDGDEKDQLEEKVLFVNRCAKVLKGGRKFSFSALVLVGDSNGTIGIGFAKANEVVDAIKKGGDIARKNLEKFHIIDGSIAFDVQAKFDGSCVLLKSAPKGTGVIAGSHVRSVLEMVGVTDIVAKNLGSNNPNNQVIAAIYALRQLVDKKEVLSKRMAL
jgi:small subunit ribosomal protein S5